MTKILIDEATVKQALDMYVERGQRAQSAATALQEVIGFTKAMRALGYEGISTEGVRILCEALIALQPAQQHPHEFKCPLCYDDPTNIKEKT